MTPEQKNLVRDSFELVLPNSDAVAEMFYNRLFELNPNLRPLFKGDMGVQGRSLMNTLKLVVRGLDNLEPIMPAVRSLGQRHVTYSVKPEDYTTVGEALLWTLDKGLGEKFTPDTKEAWTQAYTLVAGAMIEASKA